MLWPGTYLQDAALRAHAAERMGVYLKMGCGIWRRVLLLARARATLLMTTSLAVVNGDSQYMLPEQWTLVRVARALTYIRVHLPAACYDLGCPRRIATCDKFFA